VSWRVATARTEQTANFLISRRMNLEFLMLRAFTEHPATVGETYLEHLLFAGMFGCRMLAGGAACCIHAVIPFLFTSTGSRTVLNLSAVMVRKRAGQLAKSHGGAAPEYAI